jgi:hypothetical protein
VIEVEVPGDERPAAMNGRQSEGIVAHQLVTVPSSCEVLA